MSHSEKRRLDGLIGGSVRALCLLAAAALGLMMSLTVIDVVLRWMGSGIPGIYEIVTLGMRIVIPLALPYVFWTGGNVAVEILTDRLPATAARLIVRMGSALGALVMAYLTYAITQRAKTVWEYGELTIDLSLPQFLYWIPWIVGCAISVPVAISLAFRDAPHQPPAQSAS